MPGPVSNLPAPSGASDTGIGTGYFIGDGVIITAGHVMFDFNERDDPADRHIRTMSGSSIFWDPRQYEYNYTQKMLSLPNPLPTPGPDQTVSSQFIEPFLVNRDIVFVTKSGNVDKDDAGLITYLTQSDITSQYLGLTSSAIFRRHGTTSGTDTATTISLSGVGIQLNIPSARGDSGGGNYIQFEDRRFIVGNTVSTDEATYTNSTYITTSEFYTINEMLQATQSNNVTLVEPTNMIVGSSGGDNALGTYRADIFLGKDGNDIFTGDPDGSGAWGNDQLFGGDGEDRLKGGRGFDLLHGGDHRAYGSTARVEIVDDDTDTADYNDEEKFIKIKLVAGSDRDATFKPVTSPPSGSPNATIQADWDKAIFVETTADTFPDPADPTKTKTTTDTLISIEIIEGSDYKDEVYIKSFTAAILANADGKGGLKEIDLRGETAAQTDDSDPAGDLINLVDFTQAVKVNLATGLLELKSDATIKVTIKDAERVTGGSGDDEITGDGEANTLIGRNGIDTISDGEAAAATVWANDALYGGAGNDMLSGGRGNDLFHGGDHRTYGSQARDEIDADGTDTVSYRDNTHFAAQGIRIQLIPVAEGSQIFAPVATPPNGDPNDTVQADFDRAIFVQDIQTGEIDTLISIEKIVGTAGKDILYIKSLTALQLAGSDQQGGLLEVDLKENAAGAGNGDLVDITELAAPVRINLSSGVVALKDDPTITFRIAGIENVTGSDAADEITGNQSANVLLGGGGNDVIAGGSGTSGAIAPIDIAMYTDDLDGGLGDDFIVGGGDYNRLRGGAGNDRIVAKGRETHIYGGEGNDKLAIGAQTFVEETQGADSAYYGGIQLYGGVRQWWMEGNQAFWSPFSTLLAAFPVIGAELLYTAAFFVDQHTMKFATYMRDAEGNLQMNLGWGHAGTAVVKDYDLDLDSGLASAGIAVFQTGNGGDGSGNSLARINSFVNLALYAGFGHGLEGYDPLVLDLDGDGYELTTEINSRAYFEFDNDGFGERTGWVRGDDGLLAIDINLNGVIDNVTELFGNRSTSGFAMLGAYDLNTDGVINASDAVYANLRVWRDLDQDGVTDAGELSTLAALGIVSISLANVAPTEPTAIGGNEIARTGSFAWAGGGTGAIADVTFVINETATRWLGDSTVSGSAAALPQLKGFGEVKDLRVAMTGDPVLEDLVEDFVANATTDLDELKADAETILYRWAGVGGVAADAIGANGFDARKLAFLEEYSGYQLMARDTNGDPLLDNIEEMEALWADQVMRLTLRLVIQGPMAEEFDGISYRDDLDLLVADTATALGDLYAGLLEDLPSDPVEALTQWQDWAPLLGAMADGMRRFDANMVRVDYVAAQLLAAMDGVAQPLDFETLAEALGIANLSVGTGGNNMLARGAAEGTAIYLGNGGTDTIEGGTGQDVYIFGETIGHVTIDDEEGDPAGDRIRFAFLTPDDVTMERDGNDLLITVTATGETVRVLGQFAPVVPLGADVLISSNKGVEEVQFADGTVYEIPEIMSAVGTGSDGDDHMVGTMHSDVFLGGLGDDLLEGGDDADLYVVNAGEGDDAIHDVQTSALLRAADLLVFGDDLFPEALSFSRVNGGDDLLITIGEEGQSILIEDQFAYTVLGYNYIFAPNTRIEAFAFREVGDNWGIKDLQQQLIADATTAGDDTTMGFGDNDMFGASAGDDLLIGLDGQDRYQWGAGSGDDRIDEQSRYIDVNVGLGGLSLTLEADTVELTGLVYANIAFSRTSANDLAVTIISTGETLTIVDQFAGFQTGMLGAQWFDRIEWFEFADGSRMSWQAVLADIATGGDGNDSLYGDLYADRFEGGLGSDFLSGRGYGDTYVFGLGDGHDTLADDNASLLGEGFVTLDTSPDILELGAGIAEGDISFERNGDDVTLVIGAGGDRVTLQDQDHYFHTGVFGAVAVDRIEEIRFHGGAVWTWQQLNNRVITAATTSGNDTVSGFMMADRFEASAGDDVLSGRDSGDTYVFGPGSGHDIIQEGVSNVLYGDFDIVEFGAAVVPGDVAFSRDGGDLIVTLLGGDTLRIDGQFDYQAMYTWTDVELFRFAGGTEWTKADVQAMMLTPTSGNDHLIGFNSDDTLDGAAGNDMLEGGDGSDIYLFGLGGGSDVIRESHGNMNVGEYDRVVFGTGVLVSDVLFSRDEDDLVATIVSTGQTLTIEGHFSFNNWYAWNDIEQFSFADGTNLSDLEVAALILGGTPGNDHLVGTFRSDTLDGGAGNDLLEGGDGADRYVFGLGYGDDEIRESLSNANLSEDDQLEFGAGITLAGLNFSRSGNDLLITVDGAGDSLLIDNQFAYSNWYTWWDIDRFVFADGTTLSKEQVQQIILTPTAGADHMLGFMTGDLIDGGAGNDILEGGDGADTYVFGLGYGQDEIVEVLHNANLSENDTLRFGPGIEWEDLVFGRTGDTLTIGIAGTSDTLTIDNEWTTINDTSSQTWWDVENFVLDDGTVRSKTDVQIAILAALSTAGNDTITGFYTADTIAGGAGNDLFDGGRSGDTFIHNVGDGHDTVADFVYYWGSTGDRLLLGAGITTADVVVRRSGTDADDMVLNLLGGQSSVTLRNQITGGREWTLDLVEFADGTTWSKEHLANLMTSGASTPGDDVIDGTSGVDQLLGGGGNDILRGQGGDDLLDGGAGNDRLEGSSGTDVYIYQTGGGDDVISEYTNHWQGTWGRLDFGAGIAPGDIRFAVGTNPGDMLLTFASMTGSVLLEHQIDGGNTWGIYEVRFADGTVWSAESLGQRFTAALVSNGNDTVAGTWRNDIIEGGLGNDTLRGADGDDLLEGGAGDDRMEGSSGLDVYLYAPGDGNDVVSENTEHWQGTWGRLEFGAGINPNDIRFALGANAGDMLLTFASMAGSVLLEHQIDGGNRWGVYEVRFADGTIWSSETLGHHFTAALVSSGDDTVTGSWRNDIIEGGLGNDTLRGADGNDVLDGGAGNDYLEGSGGNDIYRYALGGGDDTIYEYVNYWQTWDVIELAAGIAPADILFRADPTDVDDMIIAFANGSGSITIENQLQANDDWWVDQLKFANGTTWDVATLLAQFAARQGTAGDDFIAGTANGETLNGGTGNDTIRAQAGNDILNGGDGDDILWSEAGTDTINGGSGTDTVDANLQAAMTVDLALSSGHANLGSGVIESWNEVENVIGGSGNDTIHGTASANILSGRNGTDSLYGRDGNDILIGGIGDDTLDGGAGDDVFQIGTGEGSDYINGGDGTDTIVATAANLAIVYRVPTSIEAISNGGFANVTIAGNNSANVFDFSGMTLTGIARIDGFNGNDTLTGSAGADVLVGGNGDDVLNGGGGDDLFLYGLNEGWDYFTGGDGYDTIAATAANITIWLRPVSGIEAFSGGGFANIILGMTNAADSFDFSGVTLTGILRIDLGEGNDVFTGSAGADTIYAYRHDDTLNGGGGDDTFLYGTNDGYDQVAGGDGTDTMVAIANNSWMGLRSLSGIEAISSGGFSNVAVWGSTLNDTLDFSGVTLTGIVKIDGNTGDDVLTGSAGADTLVGGGGNDTLAGGLGNDVIDGGAGTDTIDYSAQTNAWTINLAAASNHAQSGSETDTLIGIDNATGGAGADTITGIGSANVLIGGAGNDRITGGAGNDTIQGGLDSDVAVFAGLQASYSIGTVGGSIQIVDNQTSTDGNDGTDTLSGVEVAEFKNGVQVGLSAPIVLDLDGDGVELVDRAASTARFDWNGDGILDATGWIGGGDGILVYDRDGDGNASNAREMSFLDDKAGARSDLDGLSAFDSDGDGHFSAGDAAWADFKIWMDADLDGIVDAGELATMAGAGVASISLAGEATNRQWGWGDNIVVNNGSFERADGSLSSLADVAFNYDPSRAAPVEDAYTFPETHAEWWSNDLRQLPTIFDGPRWSQISSRRPIFDRSEPIHFVAEDHQIRFGQISGETFGRESREDFPAMMSVRPWTFIETDVFSLL